MKKNAKTLRMGFAISPAERVLIRRAARAAELQISEWMRLKLVAAAERETVTARPELDADGVPVQATVPGGFAKASQDDL